MGYKINKIKLKIEGINLIKVKIKFKIKLI